MMSIATNTNNLNWAFECSVFPLRTTVLTNKCRFLFFMFVKVPHCTTLEVRESVSRSHNQVNGAHLNLIIVVEIFDKIFLVMSQ